MKRIQKKIATALMFVVMVATILSGCRADGKRPPNNLVPEHVMVLVLADFFLVEGVMIQQEYLHQKMPDSAVPLYAMVFEKHDVTREAFLESLEYYSNDAARIDRIYDLAILQISKEQTRIAEEQKE